jgi:hypothetical protein
VSRVPSRARTFVALLFAGLLASVTAAPAAVDLSTGIRYVYESGTMDECATKAQASLSAFLQNTHESAAGSMEWIAEGPMGASGPQMLTASGTVHCYAAAKGYVVTFTCVAETPANPYTADALCLDIAHTFSGKAVTPLPTPSPVPTGCNTQNLIGDWQSDDDPKVKLKMDSGGGLTDQDGVSGNWILYGDSANLTYYGDHKLKLSPDGKHLSGSGYHFTRKC